MVNTKSIVKLAVIFLLTGCGGEPFGVQWTGAAGATEAGGAAAIEYDAGAGGAAGSVALGSGGVEDSGITIGAGGSVGAGGAEEDAGDAVAAGGAQVAEDGAADSKATVPPPSCCADADCPASAPFCSPWGTCYQGGDPYNCDYDNFCESFCVHCSGRTAGACAVTSAPGSAHTVKSCVCS